MLVTLEKAVLKQQFQLVIPNVNGPRIGYMRKQVKGFSEMTLVDALVCAKHSHPIKKRALEIIGE